MAYAANFLQSIEESLTCPVCLELFDEPQILLCLHNLCTKCCQDIKKENKVRCPECREISKESDIKVNFVLKGQTDVFKKKKAEDVKERIEEASTCILCEIKTAKLLCHTCERFLCEICLKSHYKTKICTVENSELITDVIERLKKHCQDKINQLEKKKREKEEKLTHAKRFEQNKFDAEMSQLQQSYEKKLEKLRLEHQT